MGLPKQWLTVIGARTSNGKSVLALNMAYDLAIQKKRVFFLSLEMTIPRLVERLFCMQHTIHNYDLKQGQFALNENLKNKWEEFSDFVQDLSFIASDMIGKDWKEVEEYLKKISPKPDAVFIDHIQEIRGLNQKVAIDDYLSNMRELCIRNDFALVICSQCNRLSYEDQKDAVRGPQLHHLKSTGDLEQKADIVLLLHWPYHYDKLKTRELLEINIAKNRDGETGYQKLRFRPQNFLLSDWEETP